MSRLPADAVLPPIPRRGISLLGIRRFSDEVRSAARSLLPPQRLESTADYSKVASAHVTAIAKSAYSELLDGDASLVGDATVFVSHAWNDSFSELIDALSEHEREKGHQQYYWLDVCVNNQHATENKPFLWWQTVFRDNIERIGHTVIVMRWLTATPLTRVWCLWELYSSCAAGNVQLDLALSGLAKAEFDRVFGNNKSDLVTKHITMIDLRDAQATNPKDKADILAAVEATPGGLDAVTTQIRGVVKNWVFTRVRSMLLSLDADQRAGSRAVYLFSRMLINLDHRDEAAVFMREQVDYFRRTVGMRDYKSLAAANLFAHCLTDLAEREHLEREVFDGACAAFGNDHPDTLVSQTNLASTLLKAGKNEDALKFYRGALNAWLQMRSPPPDEATKIMLSIQSLLESQGKELEAQEIANDALRVWELKIGPAPEPAAFVSQNSMGAATFLVACGRADAADGLFQKVLAAFRLKNGPADTTVFNVSHLYAQFLHSKGKFSEAVGLRREVLAACRDVFGDSHFFTHLSVYNLAESLITHGGEDMLREALHCASEAVAGLRTAKSDVAVETFCAMRAQGRALAALGDATSAVEVLRAALGGLEKIGSAANEAKACASDLAAALKACPHN